ncbi:ABC transporter substrate-binding protein [Roseococcus sp.]|uniref:ABC transporter substrate-binding protein n=1 Tax=Roseococcus sp. TaxID=2109646 RepID=UPI003BA98B75
MIRPFLAATLLAAGLAISAQAATFRWANDGDVNSMDPYTRSETFLLTFNSNIYEPLIRRNPQLRLEPALAERWEQVDPTTWRFHLRRGVKFSDGSPFTAADVVFSIARARGPGSNIAAYFASVDQVTAPDDFTVVVTTKLPNPIFPEEITSFGIMSKAWLERNNAQRVADLTSREENFATRNAMGTGPFLLASREPDRRTVLTRNPNWWDTPVHNLDRIEFNVIANDATRVAALLSGEVDMIYTVPPQDMPRIGSTAGLRVIQNAELRTIYLGMDQNRAELLKSDVRGRNPFQDVRVRRAMYQAIDIQAIRSRVMRGQSRPTGQIFGPGVNGFLEANDQRLPLDVDGAKRLLAEAGYPNGFGVTMDCPNDRYVNDEGICQAAVAMLARIGVRVTLAAQTRVRYFAEVNAPRFNTSFYLLGWTPNTYDAHNALFNLAGTRDGTRGMFNNGGFSHPQLDSLIDQIAVEANPARRQELITQTSNIIRDEALYIPLHQQQVVWAARTTVQLEQQADNGFPLRLVRVGN